MKMEEIHCLGKKKEHKRFVPVLLFPQEIFRSKHRTAETHLCCFRAPGSQADILVAPYSAAGRS